MCGSDNCPFSSLFSFDSTDDCCQEPVDLGQLPPVVGSTRSSSSVRLGTTTVDPSLLDFLASQEQLLEAGSSTDLRMVSSNLSHGLARMAELQDRLVQKLLDRA